MAERSERNRTMLGVGSLLSTVGGTMIVLTILLDPQWLHGVLAFPAGFAMGIMAGVGGGLALANLRPSSS